MQDDSIQKTKKDARMAGLLAFHKLRKQGSREKLLNAAIKLFCRDGYAAVTIDDITAEAGVSRVTFYRHFATKSAIALDLFQHAASEGAPRMLAIASLDYLDRHTVARWLSDFFAADRDMQGILRVLSQANVEEVDFSRQVQPFIAHIISNLGRTIPAFDIDPYSPTDQRRWVEAWLLVYTILDQSNHAATRSGVASNPQMIEILADNFIAFVSTAPAT